MSVIQIRASLAAVAIFGAPMQAQRSPANELSFDIYKFAQDDDAGMDGQPFRAEGFDYYGFRGALKMPLDDERTLTMVAFPAFIENEDSLALPPTILNGSATSASGDLATLDALMTLEYKPSGSPWTYTPGLYYHHQIDYIGAGFDFGVARDLAGGDTNLKMNYAFRHDFLELNYWDRSYRGSDVRVSNNLLLAWTQVISPSLKGSLSAQYSRQDGLLSDQHNYVVLFNRADVPRLLTDEVLPNNRNRLQLNARLLASPAVGQSIGFDASYYEDDWDVRHWSVQPSFNFSLGGGVRLRAWWRYTDQRQTEFFREQPEFSSRFQTQDSDLGSFTMNSPGLTLRLPLGESETESWEGSVSVFGFDRSDGIEGIGGKLQFVLRW